MRRVFAAVGAVIVVAGTPGVPQAAKDPGDLLNFQDANARTILKRSREAVGGVEAVAQLQSLVLTGISRIPASVGPNLVECDLEIRILLPDRYLRIERAEFGERRTGFNGRRPLSVISERGKTILPPESLHKPIVESERERMLQLLLGTLAYLAPKDARVVQSVSGALAVNQPQPTAGEAAQRRADQAIRDNGGTPGMRPPSNVYTNGIPDPHTILVSVREGSQFRFSTDERTYLPAKVTYTGGSGEEVTIVYGERRAEAGLNLPHRVTTTSRGHIIDDLLIYSIAVNGGLTAATFER